MGIVAVTTSTTLARIAVGSIAVAAATLLALRRRIAAAAIATTSTGGLFPLLLLLGLLSLLQSLHQKEELAPIGRIGDPQRLVVHHLQFEEVGGLDDARGAEVGHHRRGEADALEPLLDDAHDERNYCGSSRLARLARYRRGPWGREIVDARFSRTRAPKNAPKTRNQGSLRRACCIRCEIWCVSSFGSSSLGTAHSQLTIPQKCRVRSLASCGRFATIADPATALAQDRRTGGEPFPVSATGDGCNGME